MMGGSFGPGFGSFWMGGLFGLLINVGLIVGVLLLVVWAVQRFSRSTHSSGPAISSGDTARMGSPLSAREILDIRYAKGELTREEYQTILNDLSL